MTGRDVAEATEKALDALGVGEDDAEIKVIEGPRPGLFGLVRSAARVRARVRPASVRPKTDRRNRREAGHDDRQGASAAAKDRAARSSTGGEAPGLGSGGSAGSSGGPLSRSRSRNNTTRSSRAPATKMAEALDAFPQATGPSVSTDTTSAPGGNTAVQNNRSIGTNTLIDGRCPTDGNEGGSMSTVTEADESSVDGIEVAEEFLEGLLDTFGVDFELSHRDLDNDLVEICVTGDDLGLLIGPRGQTLSAIQDLTRTVVQREGSNQRLVVDIAGYREARRVALDRFTREVVAEVLKTGRAQSLEPMPAADRKVVHDTANQIAGIATESEGEDPNRRVVISPA
ncbi:MAG: RNA-binding cell elongation regulator Jag/EloR [Acidimicrobiales bacterium]